MFDFDDVRGMLFDCDGTLLDSLGAWAEAESELFSQAGPMTRDQEDELHAAPIEIACKILHERYGVGESTQAVLDHLDGYLMEFYTHRAKPLDGACEFVERAVEHGVACAVVSSSPRRYLEAGLSRAGILECFDVLVPTDEAGLPKTDARIYQKALDALGCSIEESWSVDDAPYAIGVLGTIGLRTIAPLNGASAETEALLHERATIVTPTLKALL